jgi:general secretion pathway protein H
MKNQRGFTLLEIILALVIFASCAMMVVSTIPSRSGADIFGQQLKALVDYGSDRAVMDGNIVGLVITTDNYQLVTLEDKNGERHWVPLSAGRITTKVISRKRCTYRSRLSVWRRRRGRSAGAFAGR